MNDKEIQLLNTLAEKLGTTSEYIWGFSVKQATLDSYISLCILGALIILSILGAISFMLATKYDKSKEQVWTGVSLGVLVLALLLAIGHSFSSVGDIVTGLKNPEAKAFQTMIKELK